LYDLLWSNARLISSILLFPNFFILQFYKSPHTMNPFRMSIGGTGILNWNSSFFSDPINSESPLLSPDTRWSHAIFNFWSQQNHQRLFLEGSS
jgi:hypothetical protein